MQHGKRWVHDCSMPNIEEKWEHDKLGCIRELYVKEPNSSIKGGPSQSECKQGKSEVQCKAFVREIHSP
ncbi:aminotransferase class V-fold PLP-dependent enzyme [Sesbania bispinosa]|nr:aminotransferase class V-fold PLP-dependent enzyme [Sesbania bispinosa]